MKGLQMSHIFVCVNKPFRLCFFISGHVGKPLDSGALFEKERRLITSRRRDRKPLVRAGGSLIMVQKRFSHHRLITRLTVVGCLVHLFQWYYSHTNPRNKRRKIIRKKPLKSVVLYVFARKDTI